MAMAKTFNLTNAGKSKSPLETCGGKSMGQALIRMICRRNSAKAIWRSFAGGRKSKKKNNGRRKSRGKHGAV